MTAFVLALDTATEHCSLALGARTGDRVAVLASSDFDAPRAALSRLLPAAVELLAEAGHDIGEVAEVVVGRGPGSFTGVRIGVSSAKGIAHGLGAPLFGVGTLDAIAWRHVGHEGLLGVVGDAMRGEVYPALFEISGGHVRRVSEDRVMKPGEAAAAWRALDAPVLLAGNGLRKHGEIFAEVLGAAATQADEELWTPSGEGLLAAYAEACAQGARGEGDAGSLLPIYTRLSDAEEAETDRLSGSSSNSLPQSGVAGPEGERP